MYRHDSGLQLVEAAKYQDYRSIHADERRLCLSDGPPDMLGDMKMVSFTSPHELWLKSVQKATDHTPVWTLKELIFAALISALGIPEQEIERRFNRYCGVARVCLSKRDLALSDYEDQFEKAKKNMKNMDQIEHHILGQEGQNTVHSLIHFVPDDTEPNEYTATVATPDLREDFIREAQTMLRKNKRH